MSTFQVCFVLAILKLFISTGQTYSAQDIKNMSIFIRGQTTSYCDLECDGHNHSMCNPHNHTIQDRAKCGSDYKEYDRDAEFLKMMLDGHNGIRDRIAGAMNVANMRLVIWDWELALMAKYWLRRCEPYRQDPCTTLSAKEGDEENTYTLVKQNSASVASSYYPQHFRASTIRTWYMEKNTMIPPTLKEIGGHITFGYFNITNNFTNLAYAWVTKIGCAMIRSNSVYTIVCNYWPVQNSSGQFRFGKPGSSCPNLDPIPSTIYPRLCTSRAHLTSGYRKWLIIVIICRLINEW